ncbi:hypothetical protein [Hymenobacter baengnokdamensis]|uniref:hypothetical protein n=1 Tax=Hymenobacter baengnokdamensis TaxID=2615203 RepID=UPI001244F3D0|nr:hypothetical protein [Hymenobacter baengnokdamensis]
MLTSVQFTQLAQAAWPGTTFFASIVSYRSACGHATTTYRASYHPGEAGSRCFQEERPCPFAAVLAAVQAAAAAGLAVCVSSAGAIVAQAEYLFAGGSVPALPVVVCASCGEGRDHFGECGCSYVPLTHYAHA